MEINSKQYAQYVKEVTPAHSLGLCVARAFLTGGMICLLGQFLTNLMADRFHMDHQTAAAWTSLELIFASVLLTGFNLYQKIVKFAGAGALVPITGFANSVAAPAVEFQAEGDVFGVGCKIFTIAGPVILYGVLISWILGILFWLGRLLGLVS